MVIDDGWIIGNGVADALGLILSDIYLMLTFGILIMVLLTPNVQRAACVYEVLPKHQKFLSLESFFVFLQWLSTPVHF